MSTIETCVHQGGSATNTTTTISTTPMNHHQHHQEATPHDATDGESIMLLEPRPFRPFKTSEEYLYAMKEDLAEWLNNLYALEINVDNFFEILDTGEVLCTHANNVRRSAEEQRQQQQLDQHGQQTGGGSGGRKFSSKWEIPPYDVVFRSDVTPGSFFARDNVHNFITWCRDLGIYEVLLFETDDLVLRKNEKHVILSLLEVARRGARFGMAAPLLVQMEADIDRELEQERLAEERRAEKGCDDEDDDTWNGASHDLEPPEPPNLFYGPHAQIITNDLKSLDEMVRDLVERCSCPSQFPMVKVSEGKYRIGDTKVLIFVRILRNHVMVRVGGGWDTLEHYLDKHDPCRCRQGHRVAVGSRVGFKTSNSGLERQLMNVTYERDSDEELLDTTSKSPVKLDAHPGATERENDLSSTKVPFSTIQNTSPLSTLSNKESVNRRTLQMLVNDRRASSPSKANKSQSVISRSDVKSERSGASNIRKPYSSLLPVGSSSQTLGKKENPKYDSKALMQSGKKRLSSLPGVMQKQGHGKFVKKLGIPRRKSLQSLNHESNLIDKPDELYESLSTEKKIKEKGGRSTVLKGTNRLRAKNEYRLGTSLEQVDRTSVASSNGNYLSNVPTRISEKYNLCQTVQTSLDKLHIFSDHRDQESSRTQVNPLVPHDGLVSETLYYLESNDTLQKSASLTLSETPLDFQNNVSRAKSDCEILYSGRAAAYDTLVASELPVYRPSLISLDLTTVNETLTPYEASHSNKRIASDMTLSPYKSVVSNKPLTSLRAMTANSEPSLDKAVASNITQPKSKLVISKRATPLNKSGIPSKAPSPSKSINRSNAAPNKSVPRVQEPSLNKCSSVNNAQSPNKSTSPNKVLSLNKLVTSNQEPFPRKTVSVSKTPSLKRSATSNKTPSPKTSATYNKTPSPKKPAASMDKNPSPKKSVTLNNIRSSYKSVPYATSPSPNREVSPSTTPSPRKSIAHYNALSPKKSTALKETLFTNTDKDIITSSSTSDEGIPSSVPSSTSLLKRAATVNAENGNVKSLQYSSRNLENVSEKYSSPVPLNKNVEMLKNLKLSYVTPQNYSQPIHSTVSHASPRKTVKKSLNDNTSTPSLNTLHSNLSEKFVQGSLNSDLSLHNENGHDGSINDNSPENSLKMTSDDIQSLQLPHISSESRIPVKKDTDVSQNLPKSAIPIKRSLIPSYNNKDMC